MRDDKQASNEEGAVGLATRPVTRPDAGVPEAGGPETGLPEAPLAGRRPSPRPRLAELISEQERIFIDRQPESARLAAEAREALAGGVTSSWQISRPQPVWLSHAAGSKLYDVDGNEYVDMHGGYGVSLAGHGHPAIVAAVQNQVARGTHFAQPTRDALAVARELASRFGLPQWRVSKPGAPGPLAAGAPLLGITGPDPL